ncbi:HAD family phosphatase [Amycolatopsis sp.]|uniref:HAD family hydrolase n=1 Tax=Amycolatopsis sp. TaxID=37632 RepID=UPI002D7E94D6|nr:HAD family phosphatase [Amycolatopsis sp.]HET6703958.1 HAD family phosphatase [Amycolatopsis sp.]
MAIRAVVFDIGGVLEITGPMDFTRTWETKLGLAPDEIRSRLADMWAAGAVGGVTEAALREATAERLGIATAEVDLMMADFWTQYLGVGNTELIGYVRGLRPRFRTGILSNSFVGAREREQAAYGLESLVDDLVYSHEVGVSKPEARIYELTCGRHGVAPGEMVFVDDLEVNVAAARSLGIHAVLYRDNAQAIAGIEEIIAAEVRETSRPEGGQSWVAG